MLRRARIIMQGYPYHVTQRDNYRQKTFSDNTVFRCYLNWLNDYALSYSLSILAYCLIPNHVHFICVPSETHSLATTFKLNHMRYSNFFHSKNKLIRHLWQGRFYSCILDETHLYEAIRCVKNTPVKANLVEKPQDWKWSSAQYHLLGNNNMSLSNIWDYITINDWNNYLCQPSEKAIVKK